MTGDFFFLIPIALVIGAVALGSFIWALSSSQYEDLDGAAERILFDDDKPLPGIVTNMGNENVVRGDAVNESKDGS